MDLYLTYEKYKELGGNLSQSTFNSLITKAQVKLDFLTNNRISNLQEIPYEVYLVLVEIINIYNVSETEKDPSLSSYSNGIETFSYSTGKDTFTTIDNRISVLVREYLSKYPELLNRGKRQWKQE